MKYIFIISSLLLTVLILLRRGNTHPIIPSHYFPEQNNKASINKNHVKISYNGISYILYYSPLSGKKIQIISNMKQQKSAQKIAVDNHCTSAINGGFYTKEEKHLGLLKISGKIISSQVHSKNLLNGYFYIDKENTPHIGTFFKDDAPTIIQSGPYYDSHLPLKTKNDKFARRMIIFETKKNILYIGSIIIENQETSGPKLSDIGSILFSIQQPFSITKVLNLDGGSASYYKEDDTIELKELTYVGSIICIK